MDPLIYGVGLQERYMTYRALTHNVCEILVIRFSTPFIAWSIVFQFDPLRGPKYLIGIGITLKILRRQCGRKAGQEDGH